MMCSLHSWWRIIPLLFLLNKALGLNTDGILLLSFKYSLLGDPLGVLQTWNYSNDTPCSWSGVTCGIPGKPDLFFRVTGLNLSNSNLLGPISPDVFTIEHIRNVDFSNNSFNGSIPMSVYNASHLRFLDLSNNLISGELLELVGGMKRVEFVNLSDNALGGEIPTSLTKLRSLKVVYMKNNYFSGILPSGFDIVEILDLSSNLLNGSLPYNFAGANLDYLNISYNRFSGQIPLEFTNEIPTNATIDLSYNNFTGPIPVSSLLYSQNTTSFAGNPELCGKPLKNLCLIPSSISTNESESESEPTSPPAIAALPKTFNSDESRNSRGKNGLKATTIIGIIVGDIAGIGILVFVFVYIYQCRKRKIIRDAEAKEFDWGSSSTEERSWMKSWVCMLKRRNSEESNSSETSSESEDEKIVEDTKKIEVEEKKSGSLVTVDGDRELELETLLKASAYILGATGSSIMYKAVLEDGTTLAVRRIGEGSVERFRDFENQVRLIAKLVHPNLVRIRGFYWGTDEKLVIYDFVTNGSLANARYRKMGSSPCPLPWELRLKIAKGVAKGLTYIHEKKHVHGNLKPSNILLGPDMEPKIGDFGLERLLTGETSSKVGGSARNFGSKRSTASRESFQDPATGATPSPSPSAMGCISPYYAPESLRSLKPNPKWDVFSFGVILLELLTGKVIISDEMCPVAAILAADEKGRVLRIADVAIRGEMEGKEDAFLALVRLGYNCISQVPQKRPNMKEALQVLEKFPCSSSSFYFGP